MTALLCSVAFCLGSAHVNQTERLACEARVAQVNTNAVSFYRVEANALAMRYHNDEDKLIAQFNAALKSNAELHQQRLAREQQAMRRAMLSWMQQKSPAPATP